jgi:fibronectin type 3 domain-containing protein
MGRGRKLLAGLLLVAAVAATSTSAVARNDDQADAPANDGWANATVISGSSGTATGSNVDATEEDGAGEVLELDLGGGSSQSVVKTVWWTWTAPANGRFTFDTSGSEIDSVLGIWSGSALNALTLEAADDDSGSANTSLVSFQATSGMTYSTQVGSCCGNDGGAIELAWDATPANDAFANANTTAMTGSSGALGGTNKGATVEPSEPAAVERTVWYAWTPPDARQVKVRVSTGVSAVLSVYTGSALNDLSLVGDDSASGDLSVRFSAAAGTTYRVQVGSVENGPAAAFALTWATAPGAPTLTSAAPGAGGVTLAWSAPASNGGAPITGYNVYRGTTPGGETFWGQVGNQTGFTDPGALPGTTYYYKVAALNDGGESPLSNGLSATTVPGVPVLSPPTTGNGAVGLSWSPPVPSGTAAIAGYKVYRGTSPGSETLVTTLGNVTAHNDTGLTNGTTYYYKVSAVNSQGEGALSNEVSGTPTTVPGAPSLTLASGGDGQVQLGWSAPASNGGAAITGYKVYRGTSPGGETLLTTLGDVDSYTDDQASNGTTYYYKVSAVNTVGEGARSNERSVTPPEAATVPGAPTLNSATPGNNKVTLSWSAPADGGASITTYRIYRGTSSGAETLLGPTLGPVTEFVDDFASNGTTYYYKVSAVNSVGEGARSNELSATPAVPATVPDPPGLDPGSVSVGDSSVTLTWITPGSGGSPITGFKIYRGTSSNGETLLTTVAGDVTQFTDTGLTNGTTYYYKVSAVNAVGEGPQSSEQSGKPRTVPGKPTLDSAVAGNASVALTWSGPAADGGSPITGYKVYRRPAGGSAAAIATPGAFDTTYTDNTAVNGTAYAYSVVAVNAAGESAPSDELTATPATIPSDPDLISATAGNNKVTLSWAPTSTGGNAITNYKIYRRTASSGGFALLTTVGPVTSYVDTAVANGTVYDYQVSAVNSLGEGPQSPIRTAVPTAVIYGAPSWWNGDCDANWWNPKAADLGWTGAGAQRLGSAYLGIPTCGPRPGGSPSAPTVLWNRSGVGIPEWESSEYAFRFMNQVYGVEPYAAAPKDVVRNYTGGAGGGLETVANDGTVGKAPQPGDVIAFDNSNGVGLVGVVAWVSVDGSGTGEIRLVVQNDAGGGWRVVNVTNWVVQPVFANNPYGWLHDPLGRGSGPAPPSGGRPHIEQTEVDPRPAVPDPPTGGSRPPKP